MSVPLPAVEVVTDTMTMSPMVGAMVAAIDSFWVVVAIAIGSAIYNWLQKRNQALEDQESQSPPEPSQPRSKPARTPPPAPRQAKATSWEEELRRLLEGESPEAPPPPVIVFEERPPAAAPQPPAKARPVIEQAPPAPVRPLVTLAESAAAYQRAEQLDKKVEAQLGRVGSMAEAASALQKASGLDVAVAERMSKVTGQLVAQAAVVQHRAVSTDVARVVAMFRDPRSARQAVLASLILGPPKALDQTGSL